MKAQVKDIAGKDVKEISLKGFLFELPSNDALLHQVYVALQSNQRQVLAHTKDRAERRGSGKKPWRQKGTGRARAGSVRSPLWRKGGITFGPQKDRNFSKEANQKMRQKAVLVGLSEKARAGKLVILENLSFAEQKTKLFVQSLSALGISGKGLTLCLSPDERPVARMTRNVPRVANTLPETLNIMELLDREYLVLTLSSLKSLEERFAQWEKK